jgi:hypothetical protein
MFDRIGKLAGQTAQGLSRRTFLTRIGLSAMALAAFATGARAAGPVTCVKNGGCCGGNSPYLGTFASGYSRCYTNATCTRALSICAVTPCCNGNPNSSCVAGMCFSDNSCQNRC